MIIKDELEEGLDDLDKLNDLYNKEYINIEEFNIIKNRIVDKMIVSLHKETIDLGNS